MNVHVFFLVREKIMEQKFKNYTEYDATSFREQQNITFKAYDLSNTFI